MITAEQKPMDEIREMITPYKRLLVLGCGSCVAECAAGGEKELLAHCAERLAPHKRPKRIVFATALPRNAMGKVQKGALGESLRG